MKLTESHLRQMIRQELKKAMGLNEGVLDSIESGVRSVGDTFGVGNSSGKKVKSDASDILYGDDHNLLTPAQKAQLEKILKMGQNQASPEAYQLLSIKRHIASQKSSRVSARQDQDDADRRTSDEYNQKLSDQSEREENEKSKIKDQIEKALRRKYSYNPEREIRDEPGNYVQDDPDYVAVERGYTNTRQKIADDRVDKMTLSQLKNYLKQIG